MQKCVFNFSFAHVQKIFIYLYGVAVYYASQLLTAFPAELIADFSMHLEEAA